MSSIRLMQGDCLKKLKKIPDQSVDMIMVDLPYGTTACKWDVIIPLEPMWLQIKRVIKKGGAVVMTASQPFTSVLVSSNLKMFKYEWIWHKNKASGHLNAKKMPMKAHESVVVFGEGKLRYYPQMTTGHNPQNYAKNNKKVSDVYGMEKPTVSGGSTERYPRSVLDIPVLNNDHSKGKRYHPTQKPEELMRYFIETYTQVGDTVLDFTMGSGTTMVVCKKLKRNGIGIELEQAMYDTAKQRIREA